MREWASIICLVIIRGVSLRLLGSQSSAGGVKVTPNRTGRHCEAAPFNFFFVRGGIDITTIGYIYVGVTQQTAPGALPDSADECVV